MTEPIQNYAIDALLEKHSQTIDSIIDKEDGEQLQHLFNEVYQSGLTRGLAEHPKYTRIDVEGRAGHYAIYKRERGSLKVCVNLQKGGASPISVFESSTYFERRRPDGYYTATEETRQGSECRH